MVTADDLRGRFTEALSAMYRSEVPGYAALLRLVADSDARAIDEGAADPGPRLAVERHGAIRVGRPDELARLARLFGVLGMVPVGYYDLAAAGLPVHATAFRPVSRDALDRNPFRVFCSLLRLELIADPALREEAGAILARREIMPASLPGLIARAERDRGLVAEDAERLVSDAIAVFRWHGEASVDRPTYARLHAAHPLVADVVCFPGPHINHLTPRTLDIDAVHRAMPAHGMTPKETIEGAPPRQIPILLRQTSFTAIAVGSAFPGEDNGQSGLHTARFGEVEQRGAALTPRGRALYDELLRTGRLDRFPDDWRVLRRDGLAYAEFRRSPSGEVEDIPITYEDFLPVSAAGIFRSNLGASAIAAPNRSEPTPGSRHALESALGAPIADEFALYAEIEARSRDAARSSLLS